MANFRYETRTREVRERESFSRNDATPAGEWFDVVEGQSLEGLETQRVERYIPGTEASGAPGVGWHLKTVGHRDVIVPTGRLITKDIPTGKYRKGTWSETDEPDADSPREYRYEVTGNEPGEWLDEQAAGAVWRPTGEYTPAVPPTAPDRHTGRFEDIPDGSVGTPTGNTIRGEHLGTVTWGWAGNRHGSNSGSGTVDLEFSATNPTDRDVDISFRVSNDNSGSFNPNTSTFDTVSTTVPAGSTGSNLHRFELAVPVGPAWNGNNFIIDTAGVRVYAEVNEYEWFTGGSEGSPAEPVYGWYLPGDEIVEWEVFTPGEAITIPVRVPEMTTVQVPIRVWVNDAGDYVPAVPGRYEEVLQARTPGTPATQGTRWVTITEEYQVRVYDDLPDEEYEEGFYLEELEVPLAEFPSAEEYEYLVLEDVPVPLAQMPQAGLVSMAGVLTSGMMMSAFIGAVVANAIRKMKDKK